MARYSNMRLLVGLVVLVASLTSCGETNDKTSLTFRLVIPELLEAETAVISERDAERIQAPGTEFEIRSSTFGIVTSRQELEGDSIEFCFDDAILVKSADEVPVQVAPAGTCVFSWISNKLAE